LGAALQADGEYEVRSHGLKQQQATGQNKPAARMSAEKTRRAKSLFCKAAQLGFMCLHGGRLLAPPFLDEFLDVQSQTTTVRLGQTVNRAFSF
jgi:hypothetical protein